MRRSGACSRRSRDLDLLVSLGGTSLRAGEFCGLRAARVVEALNTRLMVPLGVLPADAA